ncbi:MAG: hypothetical protein ABI543_13215, partial [Ignavibacteria bacterium]
SAGEETVTLNKSEHEKLLNESAELVKFKENNSTETPARIKELEISVNSLHSEKESITKKYNELESGIKQQYYEQLSDEHRKIALLIPTVDGLREYVKLNSQKAPAGSDSARPGAGFSDSINSKWDELNYNEKEELRKKRPEHWRKLYREKFGSNP